MYLLQINYYTGSDNREMLPLLISDCKNKTFCPLEVFSDLVKGVFPEDEKSLCSLTSSVSRISTLSVGFTILLSILIQKLK